jgi:hypothetical protein
VVSAPAQTTNVGWRHCRRLSTTGELRGLRRVIEGTRTPALRDHNLIRPLALRELPDLKAGRPAVPLRRW